MFPSTLPLPFPWGDPGPHLMRGFLSPPRVYSAVDILIGSDVFAGHTVVTNRHTDRPTDRPRYSVCRNRPHSILWVRCGLAVSWWCLSFTLAKRLAGKNVSKVTCLVDWDVKPYTRNSKFFSSLVARVWTWICRFKLILLPIVYRWGVPIMLQADVMLLPLGKLIYSRYESNNRSCVAVTILDAILNVWLCQRTATLHPPGAG